MAYGNSNPGPPGPSGGDMFSDGDGAAPEKKEGTEEEGGGQTGILPKSLMAGKTFAVGDEIVLKIDHIGEDSFEVSYSHGEGGKDEGYEGDKMMADKTGGSKDMAAMME